MVRRFGPIACAAFAIALGIGAAGTAHALTDQVKDAARELGRVTGIGLYCGYNLNATATKQTVIDVVTTNKLNPTDRGTVGQWYAEGRDMAFAAARDGLTCPRPDAYMDEIVQASQRLTTAFH